MDAGHDDFWDELPDLPIVKDYPELARHPVGGRRAGSGLRVPYRGAAMGGGGDHAAALALPASASPDASAPAGSAVARARLPQTGPSIASPGSPHARTSHSQAAADIRDAMSHQLKEDAKAQGVRMRYGIRAEHSHAIAHGDGGTESLLDSPPASHPQNTEQLAYELAYRQARGLLMCAAGPAAAMPAAAAASSSASAAPAAPVIRDMHLAAHDVLNAKGHLEARRLSITLTHADGRQTQHHRVMDGRRLHISKGDAENAGKGFLTELLDAARAPRRPFNPGRLALRHAGIPDISASAGTQGRSQAALVAILDGPAPADHTHVHHTQQAGVDDMQGVQLANSRKDLKERALGAGFDRLDHPDPSDASGRTVLGRNTALAAHRKTLGAQHGLDAERFSQPSRGSDLPPLRKFHDTIRSIKTGLADKGVGTSAQLMAAVHSHISGVDTTGHGEHGNRAICDIVKDQMDAASNAYNDVVNSGSDDEVLQLGKDGASDDYQTYMQAVARYHEHYDTQERPGRRPSQGYAGAGGRGGV
jgi:hypothetical protein